MASFYFFHGKTVEILLCTGCPVKDVIHFKSLGCHIELIQIYAKKQSLATQKTPLRQISLKCLNK